MSETRTVALVTFIVSCACATLGLMISISFMIFHIYHRKNRIVRMSSPRLNIVISTGGICLSMTCLLYGMDFILVDSIHELSSLCQARTWLLLCSFSLVYAPITCKTWRVYQIFKLSGIKVVIRDGKLLLMTGGFVAVDIVLLTLWQTIDPLMSHQTIYTTQVVNNSVSAFSRNNTVALQECVCNKMEVWIAVALTWKLVLLIYGLHLAWKVKDVTVPSLNDSAYIIFVIFGTVILGMAVVMVTYSFQEFPDAVYILTSVCISAGVIFIQLILFVPKIVYWLKAPTNVPIRMSSSSLRDVRGDVIDDVFHPDENENEYHGDDGIMQIVQENKYLRESLSKKEELITELQMLVNRAKEKLTSITSEVEVKQDSGLDIDLSSASTGDVGHHHGDQSKQRTAPDLKGRIARYRVGEFSRMTSLEDDVSQTDVKEYTQIEESRDTYVTLMEDDEEASRQVSKSGLNHNTSIRSVHSHKSFTEMSELRNSITEDLSHAAFVSSNLRRSVSRDMDKSFSETEWLYQSNESKDLTESIAQSYDLDQDQDTFTYLNTYIPRGNSLYQIRRSRKRNSGVSIASGQSSDNISYGSIEVGSFEPAPEVSAKTTGSATPDSQHHAAILRYYSYRHIKDNTLMQLNFPRRRHDIQHEMYFSREPSTVGSDQTFINKGSETLENGPGIFTVNNSAPDVPVAVARGWNEPVDPYDSFV